MKVMKTGGNTICSHIQTASEEVQGNPEGCEDCEKIGSTWVHLRLCLECGHVGCCDSSVNKHATKHFKQTVHPALNHTNQEKTGNGATLTLCLSSSKFAYLPQTVTLRIY
jgi:uncharacterized UBP type Zn finger protein